MVRKPASREAGRRKPNMREAILAAAEELFSTNGFNAVSVRDIALAAGANPGSVTYHFTTKDGLLLEIYRRHCGPMNLRRSELLAAAKRVRDLQDRLEAIVRAYVLPAFTSGSDLAGGGARFTRLRAVMSAEGNEVVRKIIAQTFDDTSHAFIDAIHDSLPHIPRNEIVWRSHFLLGALYYSLVTPERVSRLSRGGADGTDAGDAIEQLVRATVASLQAPALDQPAPRGGGESKTNGREDAACSRRPFPGPIRTRRPRSSSCRRSPATRIATSSGPHAKYPYAPDRPYTPPDAGLEDFRALHAKLGVGRAVIVNASVHGTDNRVALDAIAASGGAYRAVANIDDTITERGLRELHEGGFRGCRFNFVRHLGGVPDKRVFDRVIAMIAPLGWHVDLHFDAIDLPELCRDAGEAAGALHHRPYGPGEGLRRPRSACRSGR